MCVVVLCWIDHVWSSKECVCCACDPSERLSAPSDMFCLCFCMSEVISSFRSLRAGSQVFASPYVISLSDFAYYVFGQEPAVAVHLAPLVCSACLPSV